MLSDNYKEAILHVKTLVVKIIMVSFLPLTLKSLHILVVAQMTLLKIMTRFLRLKPYLQTALIII